MAIYTDYHVLVADTERELYNFVRLLTGEQIYFRNDDTVLWHLPAREQRSALRLGAVVITPKKAAEIAKLCFRNPKAAGKKRN